MSRCTLRGRAAGLLLGLLSLVGGLAGPDVDAQNADPFARVDVQLPGPLLSTTVIRLDDGGKRLAVLVGPPKKKRSEEGEDGEGKAPAAEPPEELRSLLLIDPADGRLEPVADRLPKAARRLTAAPREGADDLIAVVTRRGAFLIDPRGASAPAGHPVELELDGDPDNDLETAIVGTVLLPDDLSPDRSGILAAARPGILEIFRARPDGTLETTGSLPLPKRAERTRWGLRITSPPVHRIDDAQASPAGTAPQTPCWAVGPEAQGPRRLRTLLYCLGEDEPTEVWSLLPDGETVTETHYTRYGERPILVVLTRTKLGLFVKQQLRLFPLEASRNRVGTEPILAAETGCPLWHGSSLGFADVDGDGLEDLYLVCKKGLVDQELRLEAYAAEGDGTLRPKARAVELDGDYSSWDFGSDWTGDDLPDLLAIRRRQVEVHQGTGNRRRPIDRNIASLIGPWGDAPDQAEEPDELEVEIEAEADGGTDVTVRLGGPRILGTADLTGDGRPELVVYRGGTPGGRITILRRR